MKKYKMTGTCTFVGQVENVGKNGNFRKRIVVLCDDPNAEYPNYLAWELVQDKVTLVDEASKGKELTIEGYPASRAYQNKQTGATLYFTSIRATAVEFNSCNSNQDTATPTAQVAEPQPEMEVSDDLPF